MTPLALKNAELENPLDERVAYLLQELRGMAERASQSEIDPAAFADQLVAGESAEVQAAFFRQLYRGQLAQTAAVQAEKEKLESQASTDTLTGLPNSRALLDRVVAAQAELARASDPERPQEIEPYFIIGIDLINFKKINDGLGYETGNTLMRAFATRILRELRMDDFVGRLGGDEFVVLMQASSLEDAEVVVRRLEEAAAEKFKIFVREAGKRLGRSIDVPVGISAAALPLQQSVDAGAQLSNSIDAAKLQREMKASRARLAELTGRR